MSAIAGVLVILRLKMSGCGGKNILYVIQQHPDNTKHWLSKSVFTVQRRHTDTLGITDSRKTPQPIQIAVRQVCTYVTNLCVKYLTSKTPDHSSLLFSSLPALFLSLNQVMVKTDHSVCLVFLFAFRKMKLFFLNLIRKTRSRRLICQQKKKKSVLLLFTVVYKSGLT